MKFDWAAVGHYGETNGRHSFGEPRAQFLTSKNCHAHLAEVFVAAGMVGMHVRVDQKANGSIRELTDCGNYFFGERAILGVHQKDPVWSHKNADRATFALKCVEVGGQLRSFDLDFAEVDSRSLRVY